MKGMNDEWDEHGLRATNAGGAGWGCPAQQSRCRSHEKRAAAVINPAAALQTVQHNSDEHDRSKESCRAGCGGLILADNFTAVATADPAQKSQVDVFTDKPHAAVHEQEMSPANMVGAEVTAVGISAAHALGVDPVDS